MFGIGPLSLINDQFTIPLKKSPKSNFLLLRHKHYFRRFQGSISAEVQSLTDRRSLRNIIPKLEEERPRDNGRRSGKTNLSYIERPFTSPYYQPHLFAMKEFEVTTSSCVDLGGVLPYMQMKQVLRFVINSLRRIECYKVSQNFILMIKPE